MQSQERLRAPGCYKQCSLSVLFLPSLSNRKYAGPRPPSGLIREGRREHGGADKTLIASLYDIKTFILLSGMNIHSKYTLMSQECVSVWCMMYEASAFDQSAYKGG